jgi:hypothetical protein
MGFGAFVNILLGLLGLEYRWVWPLGLGGIAQHG